MPGNVDGLLPYFDGGGGTREVNIDMHRNLWNEMVSSRTSLLEYAQSLFFLILRRPLYPLLALGICSFFTVFHYQWSVGVGSHYWQKTQDPSWNHSTCSNSLLLDGPQCRSNFPGLFQEVDRMVVARYDSPITKETLDAVELRNGYIRGMLYDQEVWEHVLHLQSRHHISPFASC